MPAKDRPTSGAEGGARDLTLTGVRAEREQR